MPEYKVMEGVDDGNETAMLSRGKDVLLFAFSMNCPVSTLATAIEYFYQEKKVFPQGVFLTKGQLNQINEFTFPEVMDYGDSLNEVDIWSRV